MNAIFPPGATQTCTPANPAVQSDKQANLVRRPIAPTQFTGGALEAHREALSANEPVFLPAPVYVDDRGWSIMNQLQGVMGPDGQINYSVQYPGVVKAWHRHVLQTDFWLCLNGHLKVGVYREEDGQLWTMVTGEKRPGVVIIPPSLWHGATVVGEQQAGLLYFVTHAYDPAQPDEERRGWDSVAGFSWGVEHR